MSITPTFRDAALNPEKTAVSFKSSARRVPFDETLFNKTSQSVKDRLKLLRKGEALGSRLMNFNCAIGRSDAAGAQARSLRLPGTGLAFRSQLDFKRMFPLRLNIPVYLSLCHLRIGCPKCARQGSYRLARLADRYGAEVEKIPLLDHLAGDCKLRDVKRLNLYDRCGAHFSDWNGLRPPDVPAAWRPALRVVR